MSRFRLLSTCLLSPCMTGGSFSSHAEVAFFPLLLIAFFGQWSSSFFRFGSIASLNKHNKQAASLRLRTKRSSLPARLANVKRIRGLHTHYEVLPKEKFFLYDDALSDIDKALKIAPDNKRLHRLKEEFQAGKEIKAERKARGEKFPD